MIEKFVLDYLSEVLPDPVYMMRPMERPDRFYIVQKTGSGERNHIFTTTIVVQSYAPTLYEAATMNETMKDAMRAITSNHEIPECVLNSDYEFTNTADKSYRYQAVFDLVNYI